MAKTISTKMIREGMILAEPLINNFGQILLPAGTEVNDGHLQMLKLWNIQFVRIVENPSEDNSEISDELRKIASDKIAAAMNWQPERKIERNMFSAAIFINARRMTES